AANPYLLEAGALAGGLDGITRNLDPGKRLDVKMYEPGRLLPPASRGCRSTSRRAESLPDINAAARGVGWGLWRVLCQIAGGGVERLHAPSDRVEREHTLDA